VYGGQDSSCVVSGHLEHDVLLLEQQLDLQDNGTAQRGVDVGCNRDGMPCCGRWIQSLWLVRQQAVTAIRARCAVRLYLACRLLAHARYVQTISGRHSLSLISPGVCSMWSVSLVSFPASDGPLSHQHNSAKASIASLS
jgi:hypothetical protein